MGKYITWEAFRDAAVEAIQNEPFATRLIVKYNHKKEMCILKVTDDNKWIMTKITHVKDFSKIEQFVNAASKILANKFEDTPTTTMDEEPSAGHSGVDHSKKHKQAGSDATKPGKKNKNKN